IHISGRAANVLDNESAFELSPLTRWTISGSSAAAGDGDVPGAPTFGVFPTGAGTVEAQGVGFSSLTNTRTITAGTLTLGYWDELNGPSTNKLSSAAGAADTVVQVTTAISPQAGDLIQIDSEIMLVPNAATNTTSCTVTRGSYGSTAATHLVNAAIYL